MCCQAEQLMTETTILFIYVISTKLHVSLSNMIDFLANITQQDNKNKK
jgi:hypothetical protein